MLFLNIESSSQCPKMFSEYLEEEFIDHVANSVYEFFRRRAWTKDINRVGKNRENVLQVFHSELLNYLLMTSTVTAVLIVHLVVLSYRV